MGRMKKAAQLLRILAPCLFLLAGCQPLELRDLIALVTGANAGGKELPPVAEWARSVETGPSSSVFYSNAVSSSGETVAAGTVFTGGTFGFGNSTTAKGTYGGNNILIAGYDASGIALWAKSVESGPLESTFWSCAMDSSGNVYAVGHIYGTGQYKFWDGASATGISPVENALVVKYSPSRLTEWARTVAVGTQGSFFFSVDTDSSGNIYAAGHINGTGEYDFGNGKKVTGTSTGWNSVLVKYNSAGIAQWASTVTAGTAESFYLAVCVNSADEIYVGGRISGQAVHGFGNGVTAVGGSTGYNVVVVKYDTGGIAQWARSVVTGTGASECWSVAADSSTGIYAVGFISGSSSFGFGNSITVAGAGAGPNAVILKYNSSGSAQWARSSVTSAGDSLFRAVAVDSHGQPCACGSLTSSGIYGFGEGAIVSGSATGSNLLMVKYGAAGAAQWAKSASGGLGDSALLSVAISPSNAVFAAGLIRGVDSHDLGDLVTVNGAFSAENILLAKYHPK